MIEIKPNWKHIEIWFNWTHIIWYIKTDFLPLLDLITEELIKFNNNQNEK